MQKFSEKHGTKALHGNLTRKPGTKICYASTGLQCIRAFRYDMNKITGMKEISLPELLLIFGGGSYISVCQ